MRTVLLALIASTSALFANATLPAPYDTVTSLMPQAFEGELLNARPLENLIKATGAKTVIELGSFKGDSTILIARNLPESGIVYAVDHWFLPPYDQSVPFFYAKVDVKNLYNQFLSNVIHTGQTEKIIPVRTSTLDAVSFFKINGISPDLIYVDASHDEKSVYDDLTAYFPLVKGHGVICGDDYIWGINDLPVMKAVNRFARENNLEIHVDENKVFWLLTEK
ncbi:MAG: class I SAM-dependent methyltransferase [Verrucomicrobia bacterium]|nr:class I SAM-dependent methyltransferase [Verrucomicrobiota bacterium]